jgi:hypothetical protein
MFPFGVLLGLIGGAAGVILFGPQIAQHARPVAKAVLKAAIAAMHDAQVRGAEATEAAEDLFAEAKTEVTAEVFAAAMASAEGNMAAAAVAQSKPRSSSAAGPATTAGSSTKAARKRTAVKRSRVKPSGNG